MGNSCSCALNGEGGDTGGRRVTLVARVGAVHSHQGSQTTAKPLATNSAVGAGSEPTSPFSATTASGKAPSSTRRRNLHPRPSPRLVPSAFHSVIPAIPTVPAAPHAADRQGPLLSFEALELHLLGSCPEELAKATLLALHLRAPHEVGEEDDPATGNPFMTTFERRRAEVRRLRRYVNPSMEPSLTNASHSTATCPGEEFSNNVDAFS